MNTPSEKDAPPVGKNDTPRSEGATAARTWKREETKEPAQQGAVSVSSDQRPIGQILLSEGYITPKQLEEAIEQQRLSGTSLGEIFIRRGWVTESVVMKTLKEAKRKLKLGELLVNEGVISQEELDKTLEFQKLWETKTVGEMLISLGYATEMEILEAVSKQLGIQYLDVSRDDFAILDPELRTTLARIPRSLWSETKSLPIFYVEPLVDKSKKKGGAALLIKSPHLSVVMADPLNRAHIERIERETGAEVSAYICNSETIKKGIDWLFSKPIAKEKERDAQENVRFVNRLLLKAVLRNASDIHINPGEREVTVRFRVDGIMEEEERISNEMLPGVVNVIKHESRLDASIRYEPQDGKFKRALWGHIVDIRVSTLPSNFGENVVLRVLMQVMSQKSLYDSNLPPRIERQLVNAIKKTSGVILVTGPTGSGKTTTLHRALRHVANSEINIVTIENPIEYTAWDGIMQSSIDEARGYTYPKAVRAVLRQDPDIILVGEIRDKETAQIATEAALTGHLVLSTLHTEDALGSIVRLIQLGVAEWLISSTVVTVLNQRLVRKLCECAEDMPVFPGKEFFNGMEIDDHVLEALERDWSKYRIKHPVGCKKCDGKGYRGQQVIVEQLTLTSVVRDMIREGKPYRDIIEFIREQHLMNMIFEEGLRQVVLWNTSFKEASGLPRGDYRMKVMDLILRDATETPETRRVDLALTAHPGAFVSLPSAGVQRNEFGMKIQDDVPMGSSSEPKTATVAEDSDPIEKMLRNVVFRRRLVQRILDMEKVENGEIPSLPEEKWAEAVDRFLANPQNRNRLISMLLEMDGTDSQES